MSSGIPSKGGYLEPTPFFKASISASTAIWGGSRPGTPISMRMNWSPVAVSMLLTIRFSSRMDARPTDGRPMAFISCFTMVLSIGVLGSATENPPN